MDPKLVSLREQLDEVNSQIIQLLAQRFEITRQVGQLKKEKKLPAQDPDREARQIENVRVKAKYAGLNPVMVVQIFQLITAEVVKEHKAIQDKSA